MIRKCATPLFNLSYLFVKGSYLKMVFIRGFVHMAPTGFIFGSSFDVSFAQSAIVLSLPCFKCNPKILDFEWSLGSTGGSADVEYITYYSFIILTTCFWIGGWVVTSVLSWLVITLQRKNEGVCGSESES